MTTETPIPDAAHVGVGDVPWVGDLERDRTQMRILQCREEDGLYVQHARFAPGFDVATHRHTGDVVAVTMSGAWGYKENDFVARAGSYVFEPAGSVHTLYVPDDNTEPTEVIFAIRGEVHYIDEEGEVLDVSNATRAMKRYLTACNALGLPEPEGVLR